MDDFRSFFNKYAGAILGLLIGILLAILLLCTDLYKVIIGIALVIVCVYFGNYVQINKVELKEKVKRIIDKL